MMYLLGLSFFVKSVTVYRIQIRPCIFLGNRLSKISYCFYLGLQGFSSRLAMKRFANVGAHLVPMATPCFCLYVCPKAAIDPR